MDIHALLELSHDTQIVVLMFVDDMRRIFRDEELIFLRFWQAIMRLFCINSHSVPCCLHPIIVTNLYYLQTDLTGHLSEIFAVVLQFQAPQYYEDIKGRSSGRCHEMHRLFFLETSIYLCILNYSCCLKWHRQLGSFCIEDKDLLNLHNHTNAADGLVTQQASASAAGYWPYLHMILH